MDRPWFASTVIAVFSLSVAVGSFHGCSNDGSGGNSPSSADYAALLGKFPMGSEGKGFDPYFPGEAADQAMTYAQILSSESLRYRDVPTLEGGDRIREAAFWLLDNADLDHDGKPGWGLPFAWDAFGDGSENPPDQPYTITTAIAALGLLDALDVEGFWLPEEKQIIIDTLHEVFSRWCWEVWTQDASGDSYFMYSTNIADDYFVVNVSSMFVGALQRFLSEYGYVMDRDEMTLYTHCADSAAGSIVDKVSMVSGAPFWAYLESPLLPSVTNDLVHHAYIVFGMEMYRFYGGHEQLPWTIEQSVKSLNLFFNGTKLYNYPQDPLLAGSLVDMNDPANLWGIGMSMAFYGKAGHPEKVDECLNIIRNEYGRFPDVTIFPPYFLQDTTFYPRFAAHVLYGIAVRDFSDRSF